MNFPTSAIGEHKSPHIMLEFFGVHKWVLTMMGGMFLSIPFFKEVPTLAALVGLLVTVIGGVAQIVKIVEDRAEAKRKQEIHEARMSLHRRYLAEGKLEEAGEVVG